MKATGDLLRTWGLGGLGAWFGIVAAALPQSARPPLDVVLMIDVSHSTTHPGFFKFDRELVPDTVAGFASGLEPADRVWLGTFGAKVAIAPAPVSGAAAVRQAAAGLADVGGSSPLWDALDTAANALEGATGRRAVIVVTDGRSTANRIGFAEILGRLERDRLPVVVLALDLKDLPGPDPTIRLRQLTDKTGGTYFPVKRAGVGVVIKRAVASLRP
jgi:hypothetical protein